MLKSISKIFRGGFKAEATGVILLIIFYYLLLSRTGETLSTYEFVTSLLWMNFITAISLWLQSIRFYKNALRRNDKEDLKLSAAASMCLAVMFMAGSITMQSIPPLSGQYLIIALASFYGLVIGLFSVATLYRAAQQ